ncbi:MAG: hypothetical protein OSJ70_03220 [Bacilli bacterium]|nr:hypothetical protein [Bacilli bacterium]
MEKEYPSILRDTIDFTSDTEVCNIGYYEGIFTDGRPVRVEVWSSHNVVNATIFFSIIDLEEKSEEEVKNLLVSNEIIELREDNAYVTEYEDANENIFISINVALEEHDREINKCLVPLKDYVI